MQTLFKNLYDKIIGRCDDFAKSCTQDEILVTLVIAVIVIGLGVAIVLS